MGGLSHGSLEEFCPCRSVVENISHNDRGTVRCADLLVQLLSATLYDIADCGKLIALLCDQFYSAHRSDARKRFASKSERKDRIQIFNTADFGSRMAKKSQTDIVGRNAFPVIAHADHLNPAAFDFNGNVGRAGIDRIFRELLYDGCRTLYNFTGGDLIYCVLV